MKRLSLAMISIMFVATNAFGFVFLAPLPLLWVAAGLGGAIAVQSQKTEADSFAKDAGISRLEREQLESIAAWANTDRKDSVLKLRAKTAAKLVTFRNVLEDSYGPNAPISDIKGLDTVMTQMLRVDGRMKSLDTTQSVTEFFGTADAPNYANLANVANRLAYVCSTKAHKAQCSAMMK